MGSNEHAFAAVAGADVAGAKAVPVRVIPRLGQVCQYGVEAASPPPECGHVLQHEESGSKTANRANDVAPESRALSFHDAGAAASR
ncbi:hypothetical protein GCM10023224_39250 [Streptomonospora halophila]|uniref:Uncharacterized protein n=1 Tax=Streptomonospora halophila TaxID=427369 RepID=A0ABP9GQV9_9ACTN